MSLFEEQEDLSEADSQLIENNTTWLVISVVSVLFCFIPGIIGLVLAIMANSAKKSHDFYNAVSRARQARMWTIIAFVLGGLAIASRLINHMAEI